MNSPDPLRPASGPDDLPTRANTPGLSLKAYVEREAAAIAAAGGPTMAEILEDLDRYRRPDGPTTDDIVNALHESRREGRADRGMVAAVIDSSAMVELFTGRQPDPGLRRRSFTETLVAMTERISP